MNIIETVKNALKIALGQERVSQFQNGEPNNKYACFFTTFYMYFRTVYKIKMTWAEYKAACMKVGAMNDKFFIKDRSKMAEAAGYPELICRDTASKITETVYALLLKGHPVPFSLNGEHFESIDGYEITPSGEIRFTIDDPGAQGDTFADASDLIVYREVGGRRVQSKNNAGKPRKITRVYYFEKAGK